MPAVALNFTVEDREFIEGFRLALQEYRALGEVYAVEIAEKIVVIAKGLVPERTGRLAASIRHEGPVMTDRQVYVWVMAGGPGIRETVFMEYGTYKDRPHPYMRPAFAQAAGALRRLGYSARLVYSHQARLHVRRMRARLKVHNLRRRRRGGLELTAAEARVVAREISQRLRYRGEPVRQRRFRRTRHA